MVDIITFIQGKIQILTSFIAKKDETLGKIVTDDGSPQFLITFLLSLLSASFGLAKCLKNGVAGTFKHGGVLDGLCSVQFLLAFLGERTTF